MMGGLEIYHAAVMGIFNVGFLMEYLRCVSFTADKYE